MKPIEASLAPLMPEGQVAATLPPTPNTHTHTPAAAPATQQEPTTVDELWTLKRSELGRGAQSYVTLAANKC